MKRSVILLLLSLCFSAYPQDCHGPVSSMIFQQNYNQLAAIRQDQPRLARASDFVKHNCLLAYQVKQIAELFSDDITRLTFVENAYPTIFDKENFYDVYDAFGYFSSVMRLHDFVANFDNPSGRREVKTTPDREPDFNFPNYNYPSYRTYKDPTRCKDPLSDEIFYRLLRNIMNQPDDETRSTMAVQLAENNCLTVEQIMKMGSLIEKDQKRLDYLKRTYDYTYDAGNFQYSDQLLSDRNDQEDFRNYLREHDHHQNKVVGNEHHPKPVCRVSDEELNEAVNSIKKQSFSNTQLTMAKQIVRSKQCFTALQIKQIVDIFSFESSKLEMAKFCYSYCVDKDNYYKINDSFSFSSSVDDLDKYISSQH